MEYENWLNLINSPDPSDRVEAADDIPSTHSAEVAKELTVRLRDESDLVRTCAADSLRSFAGNEEVKIALRDLLDHEVDLLTKAYAMSTYAEIADLEDYPNVIERWTKELNPRIRLHAATGTLLGLHAICVKELLNHASSSDPDLRDAAKNALKEILERCEEFKLEIDAHQ